jgi:hypothetical protein
MYNTEERSLPEAARITNEHPRRLCTLARSNETFTQLRSKLESLTAKYVKLPAPVFDRMGLSPRHSVPAFSDSLTGDQHPYPLLRERFQDLGEVVSQEKPNECGTFRRVTKTGIEEFKAFRPTETIRITDLPITNAKQDVFAGIRTRPLTIDTDERDRCRRSITTTTLSTSDLLRIRTPKRTATPLTLPLGRPFHVERQ